MPAWYDIIEMSLERKVDVAQIEESSQQIQDLISREIERGVYQSISSLQDFRRAGQSRTM